MQDSTHSDETIRQFGAVRLVRKWGDVHELVGGSEWDRWMARMWCAVHAPFVTFVESSDEIALNA